MGVGKVGAHLLPTIKPITFLLQGKRGEEAVGLVKSAQAIQHFLDPKSKKQAQPHQSPETES